MSDLQDSEQLIGTEVAIIGMSGRFPGAANLHAFWKNLCAGVESITFFSEEEAAASRVSAALLQDPRYVRAGGLMEGVDLFDARFFGCSPRDAATLDPQVRVFLECAWAALEDAGYRPETFPGAIGVYAGSGVNTYLLNNIYPNRYLLDAWDDGQMLMQNQNDFLAMRTSYALHLRGPSVTVQTACSTSLVAIHLACQSILTGECEMALAGGVSLRVPQKAGYLYREGGIHSPDGHCRAFDARAGGTVSGSAVGVVVLKRLEEALADRDTIYAVIRGSAINNDGADKVSFMAPSVKGQAEVIAQALAMAAVEPETIGYIETHGTGTALGDPIELAALHQVYQGGGGPRTCALGAVKTNIGHTDAAAGVVGLIKTALTLAHETIPPTLHFEAPNPEIDFDRGPFYVNTALSEWKRGQAVRRAGVSSFGIGGTNAHAILQEAPVRGPSGPARKGQLLLLSARSEAALEEATENLAAYLMQHPAVDLADVAYTLQVGRKPFEHRRMLVCQGPLDALAALQTRDPNQVMTQVREQGDLSMVFMFPGQGAQQINMGLELYQNEPIFREQVDRCAELLLPHLGYDLRHFLYPRVGQEAEATRRLKETSLTQPALFVIEYGLARLWMHWGVTPQALIGHSIGEYVAACLAGVLSLEEALSLVAERGRLIQSLPGGSMLAVALPEAQLRPLLPDGLALATINGPNQCVVAGTTEAIEAFKQEQAAQGVRCRILETSHAFHSAMMEPILERFAERVRTCSLSRPQIPYLSNVTGTWMTDEDATDPGYWVRHLRQTVRFSDGLIELLRQPGRMLLEVGPGRALGAMVRQHDTKPALIGYSLSQAIEPATDTEVMLSMVGRLWLAGYEIDWHGFYTEQRRHRLSLPTYPFERQRYWIEPPLEQIRAPEALAQLPPEAADGIHAEPAAPQAIPTEAEMEAAMQALLAAAPSAAQPLTKHPRPNLQAPYVAPQNEMEEMIAGVWQDFLGIEGIGINDDFFELGGDSMSVTLIVSRLREIFPVELPLSKLFEAPTIAQSAVVIETLLIEQLDQLSDEEIQGMGS